MEVDYFDWNEIQRYIVNGGGSLLENWKDFDPQKLPNYLLEKRITWKTFLNWIAKGNTSSQIVGVWKRPIFCGGWKESSFHDSIVLNFQTPSIFIDIRIPVKRNEMLIKCNKNFKTVNSLSECSNKELRILSRQHCFSGYSLPEPNDCKMNGVYGQVYTRHHIIDWNYHPKHPRPRPNQWWVELSPNNESYKEYSVIRDKNNNIPVYFERWDRVPGDNPSKFFAARRASLCPTLHPHQDANKDAILILIGNGVN